MRFAQLKLTFHSFSCAQDLRRMNSLCKRHVPREKTMQDKYSTYDIDSPFTLGELALSLGYALAAVGAVALIVNLWLLPVKMI